ncbi:MAG: hypothetical protein CMF23_10895 [Ignavibacteriae bacterium]|nr:hypothetical protein [Ignavibacteriota bacterium]
MKKYILILTLLLASVMSAQPYTVNYQLNVVDPCTNSNYTALTGQFNAGESFTADLTNWSIPNSLLPWEDLIKFFDGSVWSLDECAISENLQLAINITKLNCGTENDYDYDDPLFFYVEVAVIGQNSGVTPVDQDYMFNSGCFATLDIPITPEKIALLTELDISIADIACAYYYAGSGWTSSGMSWTIENNTLSLQLSHFSKFGGGKGTLVSSVESEEVINQIPSKFNLDQNYPNPFNPTTNIRYTLPTEGEVTLKVYNTLGVEVETLVKGLKPAGTYEIKFNADNMPSGIYFYELRMNNNSLTRKMLLVK